MPTALSPRAAFRWSGWGIFASLFVLGCHGGAKCPTMGGASDLVARAELLRLEVYSATKGARCDGAQLGQQLVMGGALATGEQAGAGREQRPGTDREHAVGRIWCPQGVTDHSLQPLRDGRNRRCHLAQLSRWLPHQHQPGRWRQPLGQRLDASEREPDRRRRRGDRAGKAEPKPRGLAEAIAMQVGQAKSFRRSGNVEQQRVRRDDEQDVDEISAGDHFSTCSHVRN